MARSPQKIDEERHSRGRRDGPQGDIAPRTHNSEKQENRAERSERAEDQEDSCGRGHALAAAKLQPDRKAVARECGDTRNHHPRGVFFRIARGQPYGRGAFAGVKDESQNSGALPWRAAPVTPADGAGALARATAAAGPASGHEPEAGVG